MIVWYWPRVSLEQLRLEAEKRPLNFSDPETDLARFVLQAMTGRWRIFSKSTLNVSFVSPSVRNVYAQTPLEMTAVLPAVAGVFHHGVPGMSAAAATGAAAQAAAGAIGAGEETEERWCVIHFLNDGFRQCNRSFAEDECGCRSDLRGLNGRYLLRTFLHAGRWFNVPFLESRQSEMGLLPPIHSDGGHRRQAKWAAGAGNKNRPLLVLDSAENVDSVKSPAPLRPGSPSTSE